ncbi:MAG TPA: hypothetical protein VGG81_09500 [Edaphobacter sp.]
MRRMLSGFHRERGRDEVRYDPDSGDGVRAKNVARRAAGDSWPPTDQVCLASGGL